MTKKKFKIYTIVSVLLFIGSIGVIVQDKDAKYLLVALIIAVIYAFVVLKFTGKIGKKSEPAAMQTQTVSDPNATYSKVRGVTYPCKKDSNVNRQDVVAKLKPNEKLTVEKYEYNGEPAIMLLNSNGLDVGNFSADMAKKLYNKEFDVFVSEITGGNGRNRGCNIVIKHK
jgi:hypothetical protein